MISKKIFKCTCLIFAFLLSFHHTVFATIPQHSSSFYVNDFANVLTQETVAHINQRSEFLDDASGAQIVVTTVDFTDGVDMETYAKNMFNEWGIGDAVENNGILLLLVIGEQEYYVATGDGTDNIITPAQIHQIIDTTGFDDDFEEGNYDEGVLKVFDGIYDRMSAYYNVSFENDAPVVGASTTNNIDNTPAGNTEIAYTNNNSVGNSFFFYFFILVLFIILVPSLSGGRRRRRGGIGRRGLFMWLMPSPLSRNRRNRNTTSTSQPKTRLKGNSTGIGGGGKASGGIGRGGSRRTGGGGRSSGGGVGRRR